MLPFQEVDANICKCSLKIFSSSQDGAGAPGGAAGGPGAPPAANEDLVDAERVRWQIYEYLMV